jgi:Leucine-rich repeat (LRR) protein
MHTLKWLRSVRLKGIKRLFISKNLRSFPLDILELSDTLEVLDLSGNQLSSLFSEFLLSERRWSDIRRPSITMHG